MTDPNRGRLDPLLRIQDFHLSIYMDQASKNLQLYLPELEKANQIFPLDKQLEKTLSRESFKRGATPTLVTFPVAVT